VAFSQSDHLLGLAKTQKQGPLVQQVEVRRRGPAVVVLANWLRELPTWFQTSPRGPYRSLARASALSPDVVRFVPFPLDRGSAVPSALPGSGFEGTGRLDRQTADVRDPYRSPNRLALGHGHGSLLDRAVAGSVALIRAILRRGHLESCVVACQHPVPQALRDLGNPVLVSVLL
jgi:hypothetical protein